MPQMRPTVEEGEMNHDKPKPGSEAAIKHYGCKCPRQEPTRYYSNGDPVYQVVLGCPAHGMAEIKVKKRTKKK
jgi:hypothetical protein